MLTSKQLKFRQARRAFSLVEVLVVIAVIGILSGIAIPILSSLKGKSEEHTAHRHAQMLASIASQALHAGDTTLVNAPDKETAVALIAVGVKGAGQMEEVGFRLHLSAEEQAEALRFLEFNNGLLVVNLELP